MLQIAEEKIKEIYIFVIVVIIVKLNKRKIKKNRK
jgi:hypothetical protein